MQVTNLSPMQEGLWALLLIFCGGVIALPELSVRYFVLNLLTVRIATHRDLFEV